MLVSGHTLRSALVGVVAGGAMLFGGASVASAEPEPGPAVPPPNCTAADLAVASGTVGSAMGDYLFTHPDVNGFFTGLRGLPNQEVHDRVTTYMADHPQTESEINGIRQPLSDLRSRCDLGPSPLGS
jgi:hemophore-related protein